MSLETQIQHVEREIREANGSPQYIWGSHTAGYSISSSRTSSGRHPNYIQGKFKAPGQLYGWNHIWLYTILPSGITKEVLLPVRQIDGPLLSIPYNPKAF
jgi:hypothetical protein